VCCKTTQGVLQWQAELAARGTVGVVALHAGSEAGAEEVAAARVVLATYSLLSSHGRRQQELSPGRHFHSGKNDRRCVSKITV
jgi:hypothetical protein